MKDVTAVARVQVVIEIGGNGPYGSGWTIDQIQKDASTASINAVRKLIEGRGAIIGEPKVIVIMAKEQD